MGPAAWLHGRWSRWLVENARVAATDPTMLYRLRDGVYTPDFLNVAIAELDLFTWLFERELVTFVGCARSSSSMLAPPT